MSSSKSRARYVGEAVGVVVAAGALQTTFKVLKLWLRARRMHKAMADVPLARYDGPGNFGGFLLAALRNQRRINDYFHEISTGLPVCKAIGMSTDPRQFFLLVRDPACIKHFLKDASDRYSKPGFGTNLIFYFMREWLGDGIFTMVHGAGAEDGGHGWFVQRKIAAGIFSKSNFQNNMGEVFVEKSKRMVEVLQEPAAAGTAVDLQAMFFGFTMDSLMRIFFGEDASTLEGAACKYGDAYDTAHRCMMEYLVPSLVPLFVLDFLPWPLGGFGGLAWRAHMALSPVYGEFRAACKTLSVESERMVNACRSDPNIAQRKDLLALFVQAEEKQHFSNTYLRDMVLNFVVAGRDTTACTLSWMFYVLATNPRVQDELLSEIDSCLPAGTPPSLKALSAQAMPYLHGVLYETLRLYPPVPLDFKENHEDDTFPDGTKVPKGTLCFWNPYSMGRDPAVYADPEVVDPKRWIPFTAPEPYAFPVFQAGPRICLGMDMAIFEAKVAATSLLQKYRFELLEGEKEKITYSATLTMSICNSKNQDSNNLWMVPHPRA